MHPEHPSDISRKVAFVEIPLWYVGFKNVYPLRLVRIVGLQDRHLLEVVIEVSFKAQQLSITDHQLLT